MKNRFLLLLSSICVLLLASCVKEPQPIRVAGITLNTTSLSLVEDETADLVATISPKDADNKTVIWSSSNGSVASVNNGKVNALKAGSTTITAKSDDGGFTASCAVTVVAKTIEVTSISLSKTELTLTEGESETITATVKPDDATDKTVSWSSSDPAVATVDGGKITAVKEGTATITAKAGDKTATCKVTVEKKVIAVESVELDKTELELTEGGSATLVATVKPDNATDKTVTWSTSDASVATVADGLVSAVSSGTAIITATAGEKEAACTVTVMEHHYSIAEIGQLEDGTIILSAPLLVVAKATLGFMVSDETGNLYVHGQVGSKQVDIGDKVQFRAKKATYRDLPELTNLYDLVKLSTSNTINYPTPIEIPDVEQISLSEAPFNTFTYCKAKGVLTGINAQSSGISYSITPFGSLARSYFLYLFYPYDYQADSDYYKSIESLIGNGLVVEYEGYFLGLNTSNGALNFLPTSIKTLITAVSSITLDKTNAHLKVGEAVTLTATVKPENATDKTVIWGSSDASVATVKDGVVTAIKEGVATITASAGDKTASCQVNVSKKIIPVESITLNKSKLSLIEGDSETLTASVKPDDATDKSVTWSSSNTSVATVSSSGLVTAKAAGTATITVRTNDGGKTAECYLTVSSTEQYVVFEDANFKAYCVKWYDTDGDWELSLAEAAALTSLNVRDQKFSSLKGIEYFTGIQILYCSGNQLTNLDLSKNVLLNDLDCHSNLLTKLDLSNNTELVTLNCSLNPLNSLDVSKNIKLKSLHCASNQLTSLDLSKNRMLEGLVCVDNQLTSLDLSNNLRLVNLQCGRNQLISLDVSKNSGLALLYCEFNLLTSLDVSKNKGLRQLRCADNQLTNLVGGDNLDWVECDRNKLTSLDVSMSTILRSLYCDNNLLTSLDVSNNLNLRSLSCKDNRLTILDVRQNTRLESLYCDSNPYLTEIWLQADQRIKTFMYDDGVAIIRH